MFFQVISDLHLERKSVIPIIQKLADTLIITGDLGNPDKPNYSEFIYNVCHQFSNVVLVAGNHDYWYSTINNTHKFLNNFENKFRNFRYLNNKCITLNDRSLFGATFWTYVSKTEKNSNDNKRIGDFSYEKRNELHFETLNIIKNCYFNYIITHHPPCRDVVRSKFSKMNDLELFVNNYPDFNKYCNKWICGHLHYYTPRPDIIINPYC
jgi:predicted phosphohydrolase